MARVLKALAWSLGILIVAAGVLLVVARSLDGPIGPVPGGSLVSGDWVRTQGLDWSFVVGLDSRPEMQLLSSPRSRTLSMVHHEGALFLPAGRPLGGRWKQWSQEALEDGRAILRIAGKRYAVTLVRASETERVAILALEIEEHDLDPVEAADPDLLWVFRVEPRERLADEA